MIFQVRWSEAAINELTAAWMNADQQKRRAITEAAYQIDLVLQNNPGDEGESRASGQRVFMLTPIGILFEIDEPGQVCMINQAWVFRTH